ncbi:MAG TPA: hypothetical protein VF783_14240 [Terriglobales bacterium]
MDNTVLYIGGAVATGIGTVAFWMLRSLVARVEASEKELAAFKTQCAERYVTDDALQKTIDAFNRSIDAVFAKLDRIEEKLDRKVDKP